MKVTIIKFMENTGAQDISRWIRDGWKPHFPVIPFVSPHNSTISYHLTLTYEESDAG